MPTRRRRIILTALALAIVFLGIAIMISSDNTVYYLPHHNALKPKGEGRSAGTIISDTEDPLFTNVESTQLCDVNDLTHPEIESKSSERIGLMPSEMREVYSDSEDMFRSEISEDRLAELRNRLFELFQQRINPTVPIEMYQLEEILDFGFYALAAGVVSNQQRDDDLHARVRDTRSRIQYWIEINPGVHLRELQRCLGCSMGAVQYHLSQLEAEGEVTSLMNGKTKHLFPPDFSTDEQTLQLTAMVRNPVINQIIRHVASSDAITQAELGRVLDVDVSVISYYVGQMLDAKVVKIIRVFGREKPLMITDWVRDCLVTHELLV